YLTTFQEKMTSTQPDMVLQYAHILAEEMKKQGIKNPIIKAQCYVTLNGRRSQLLIDPTVDLTKEKDSFSHKNWILPLKK
ncbi:MAG: HTTM domain-containing protein, partial [Cytophagales bacterium]|nr:HTTM domain-containing protein [Cytophagales bacterium]